MKKLYTLLSGVLLVTCACGQYQENMPQAKPVPPNAAALFKVLDRPLGTATGTLPISFPLCSISSGPLTAALSLDYNSTGGIKVEELGGSVGLGFNLSDGGGRITQLVRGKQDDANGALYSSFSTIKPSTFNCDRYKVNEIMDAYVDLEPDVFMYSFQGRSGKFYLKENGQVIMTRNDGLKIDYGLGFAGIEEWTITDEKGNKYYFGNTMRNISEYSGINGSAPASYNISSASWFMMQMEDMNGDNPVYFSYVMTGNVFSTYSGGFWRMGPLLSSCQFFNTGYDQGSVTTDGSEYLVSRIDAAGGYILVNSEAAWPSGPRRVTTIQQYATGGALKKQFRLNYGTPFSNERQKLTSFSELGTSGTDSLTTRFSYIENVNLPDYFSPEVDMWGFYNGAPNYNTGLIPDFVGTLNGFFYTITQWADRTANPNYGCANLLKKISYPTGGYREWDYEGNTASPRGNFFLYHPSRHLDAYQIPQNFTETSYTFSNPAFQHSFTINNTAGFSKFSYNLLTVSYNSAFSVKIMWEDPMDPLGGTEVASFGSVASGSVILRNGDYRIDVFRGTTLISGVSGQWNDCDYTETYVNTPYGQLPKTPHTVGGVRVREVRDYDPVTNTIYRRAYRYKLYSTDSTLSSGQLVTPVDMLTWQNIDDCDCRYPALTPGSSYPLAQEGGSFVIYPEVRTIDSANGWTDQRFIYSQENVPGYFPQLPAEDKSFEQGKLLQQKVYDRWGTLLYEKAWQYGAPFTSVNQIAYRIKPYWVVAAYAKYTDQRVFPDHPALLACQYYISSGRIQYLSQTIEKQYTTAGTLTDTTTYTYEKYNDYYALKRETVKRNGVQYRQKSYKYAFTPNAQFNLGLTAAEQTMKTTLLDNNFLQPLEITDSLKTGAALSFKGGVKYTFGTFNSSKLHLAQLRKYTSASSYDDVFFTAYDSYGNVTEQNRANDVKQVTLWGYNGQYPVARVRGSTYATVLALVTPATLTTPVSDAVLRTALAPLRTSLTGAGIQAEVYTYSPFYGLSSATDAAGRITYYEYDVFGRLKLVRDQSNNILKAYNYRLHNPL